MPKNFSWGLVSFIFPDRPNHIHVGILEKDKIVDLSHAYYYEKGHNHPEGMRQYLEWYAEGDFTDWVKEKMRKRAKVHAQGDVILQAAVTNPKTFYDFLGFEKHIRQIRARRGTQVPEIWYKRPGYYCTNVSPDKLLGPGEVIIPRFVEKPDYEFELALVVGKEGRPKTEKEALEFVRSHCFFTIYNDWSSRDFQKLDMEIGISVSHSKSIIGNSLGPCLVHASQFQYDANGLPDIPMKLTVNGKVRCDSNYNTVYWSFPKILAFLGGENIGVFPGDVLGSGTVGDGCIAEFTPDYPWLKEGDEIVMEAKGIGTLRNIVRVE